ncbi:hypothetical protein OH77DRAFT_413952 [Trametes cingulata]|nr:hypothetical protein OH77DRAFT_413952 [Trametes cingulata]
MLLRTASHGIPPTITLDFLIPRAILSRRLSQVAPRTVQHIPSSSNRRKSSSQASRQPTPPSSSLTPGTILTQLERDHGTFNEGILASMTHAQIEAFNDAIPQLRAAFVQGDLSKVEPVWEELKKRSLLAFFGPSQYNLCSTSVATFVQHHSLSKIPERGQRLLHDVALFCAAGGFTDGLKALMLAAIKDRQPQNALELYEQYVDLLKDKNAVLSSEETEDSEDPDSEGESDGDAPPTPPSLVRDEILLAAIVAHTQMGSFADALQTYLKAGTRIAPTTLERFAPLLKFDQTLRTKVNLYARRLNTAALLARPPTFMKHLTNLTRDNATISLERLYSTAIAGASEPEPWLAITPSQLSGTRVVLLPDFFWTSFLKSFLACRERDLAVRVWDDMLKLGVMPTIAAWNAVLDGYVNMQALDSTLTTWDMMHLAHVKPDALSYRALIAAFCTAGKIDEALERFRTFEREYLKNGVPEGQLSAVLAVYNTTINHLLFVSREEDARAIKKKMEASGPKPDITTYNTFLRYYGRKGELKTMAQVLQELEPAGVKADIYTFSTLLFSLLKARSDAGQIVLNFMTKQGVAPDTTALTAIINHQLEERTPQSLKNAMDLLSRMERGEFGDAKPNAITYTSVLTAINRGNWLEKPVVEEHNKRIWEKMQSRDILPSRVTYNVLLRASLANREPEGLENAMRYYRDMCRRRVHMSTDTWYILLNGLIGKKQWELAAEVVKDMRKYRANNITGSLRKLVDRVSRRNASRGSETAGAYL